MSAETTKLVCEVVRRHCPDGIGREAICNACECSDVDSKIEVAKILNAAVSEHKLIRFGHARGTKYRINPKGAWAKNDNGISDDEIPSFAKSKGPAPATHTNAPRVITGKAPLLPLASSISGRAAEAELPAEVVGQLSKTGQREHASGLPIGSTSAKGTLLDVNRSAVTSDGCLLLLVNGQWLEIGRRVTQELVSLILVGVPAGVQDK